MKHEFYRFGAYKDDDMSSARSSNYEKNSFREPDSSDVSTRESTYVPKSKKTAVSKSSSFQSLGKSFEGMSLDFDDFEKAEGRYKTKGGKICGSPDYNQNVEK